MARIRIVDEWLRSPVASAVRTRAVLVVADTWSEQKVLMRAYAGSADQTRPAIVLHGVALAIGPAGTDPHGPWGIHLDDARDGRAQELRQELELAAARLAGTRSPPRLADEESRFERKQTNSWKPGSPRDRRSQGPLPDTPREPTEPAPARSPAQVSRPESVRSKPADEAHPPALVPAAPPPYVAPPDAPTVMPFGHQPPAGAAPPPGFARGGAPRKTPPGWSAPRRRPLTERGVPPVSPSLPRAVTPAPTMETVSRIVGRTLPFGFRLSAIERAVLDRIGRAGRLNAVQAGEIARVEDGGLYMQSLVSKLAAHGLDIIEPGAPDGGIPSWVLRVG